MQNFGQKDQGIVSSDSTANLIPTSPSVPLQGNLKGSSRYVDLESGPRSSTTGSTADSPTKIRYIETGEILRSEGEITMMRWRVFVNDVFISGIASSSSCLSFHRLSQLI